jgi:RNA polymerase sigma-70 factor (family 1)
LKKDIKKRILTTYNKGFFCLCWYKVKFSKKILLDFKLMSVVFSLNTELSTMKGTLYPRHSDEQDSQMSNGTPIDSELFIRKTFEINPQKGCELLFRLYYSAMCTHAVRFVYSKEIAEDLVADVFFSFWNTKAFQGITQSYRSYLFRSVRNRAYNYLANELTKTDSLEAILHLESSAADVPELMMRVNELYAQVDELVASLPPQCQKIFIMNRFEGIKPKAIAESLKLSVRTVEVHIAKALGTLRTGLKDQWMLLLVMLIGS